MAHRSLGCPKFSRISLSGLLGLTLLFLLPILGAGCAPKDALQALPSSDLALTSQSMAQIHADFCSLNPETVKPLLKVIFVVDQSGSNRTNAGPAPGSDTTGSRRFLPIIDFASTVVANDSSVSLSLLTFNNQIVNSYPSSPTGMAPYFTNDATRFSADISSVMTQDGAVSPPLPADSGDTDFIATLNALTTLIQADMAASCQPGQPQQIIYSAMMVSDGFPSLAGNPQSSSAILSAVNQYVTIPNQYKTCVSNVILNTGLYFNPPTSTWTLPPSTTAPCDADLSALGLSDAESLMGSMAQAGGGKCGLFPQSIDYGALEMPQREIKYALRDTMVKNMNTVWEQGALRFDTDMDGMSDILEGQLGSNTGLRDSDMNGVSDFVEYQVFGTPCRDAHCAPSGANAFQLNLCRGLNPAVAPDGTITYPDSDNDGLNDCEEKLLLSNSNLFSTNGSWIPDLMMLSFGMNLTGLPSELQLTPQMDGLNNYQKIKGGAPTNVPINQLAGFSPMQYALQVTSVNSQQECYHLDVTNVVAMNPDDMMRIYVTEGGLAVDSRRHIRSIDRRLENFSLTLSQTDFPAY